ncbi:hypothetical protein WG908_08510 [Sphingobium sp. AN641]|uniref:hypothetical protein n=1 Tax=Sphingobium sp. AN641 TaxID=3133443 RepID=UPI0030C22417
MRPTEPLALHHSWPLFERARHFALGRIDDGAPLMSAGDVDAFQRCRSTPLPIGLWECALPDNRLDWSGEVYDIFGLPRRAAVTRDECVALYCEESRAVMERLRAYAIKHRRGFTVDVEIRPATGDAARWMRLITAPVCEDDKVVRLRGVKQWLPPA